MTWLLALAAVRLAAADCDITLKLSDYSAGAKNSLRVVDAQGRSETVPLKQKETGLCFAAAHTSGIGVTVRMEPGSAAAAPPSTPSELETLAAQDQADRKPIVHDLAERDRKRRSRVKELIRSGELRDAADYAHAALILQHGDQPDDYLLAHVLASLSAFKGNQSARWLSAATLDRYLQSVKRKQIFGTQPDPGDAKLLTDSLRKQYGTAK